MHIWRSTYGRWIKVDSNYIKGVWMGQAKVTRAASCSVLPYKCMYFFYPKVYILHAKVPGKLNTKNIIMFTMWLNHMIT